MEHALHVARRLLVIVEDEGPASDVEDLEAGLELLEVMVVIIVIIVIIVVPVVPVVPVIIVVQLALQVLDDPEDVFGDLMGSDLVEGVEADLQALEQLVEVLVIVEGGGSRLGERRAGSGRARREGL